MHIKRGGNLVHLSCITERPHNLTSVVVVSYISRILEVQELHATQYIMMVVSVFDTGFHNYAKCSKKDIFTR